MKADTHRLKRRWWVRLTFQDHELNGAWFGSPWFLLWEQQTHISFTPSSECHVNLLTSCWPLLLPLMKKISWRKSVALENGSVSLWGINYARSLRMSHTSAILAGMVHFVTQPNFSVIPGIWLQVIQWSRPLICFVSKTSAFHQLCSRQPQFWGES